MLLPWLLLCAAQASVLPTADPFQNECTTATAAWENQNGFMPSNPRHRNPESMNNVTHLHVVFSNHLDIGFNVRAWCDGDGGACSSTANSANGQPCRPWGYWVLNESVNDFLPTAWRAADAMRNSSTDRYIYMTQPWVASFYMHCDNATSGIWDWRNPAGGGGPSILQCPNETARAAFAQAVQRGEIFWHAFPHNAMPGIYDESLFNASLMMGFSMADQLNVPRPRTYSQRDETGITRAALALLRKNNVSMISLGSGTALFGLPDLFRWRDEATGDEMLFSYDHGYGGGTHILPNGHALYCSWNTDNGGPKSATDIQSTLKGLREKYPHAEVFSSTFDAFLDELPVVTQEIGDTWLYGIPSDPLKNVWFREISRLRTTCVSAGRCDPSDAFMRNFDRLLTKIPEHTWGEDTTWYLHDYNNWTNPQIMSAMQQDNYAMTVESWREQRSYLVNAVELARRSSEPRYAAFGAELAKALDGYANLTAYSSPSSDQGFKQVSDLATEFHCTVGAGVTIKAGSRGGIGSLQIGEQVWVNDALSTDQASSPALGRYVYQTLSAADFTAFDQDYGNPSCGPTTENPGCHNFNKPNMSSANPQHWEVAAQLSAIWVQQSAMGDCHLIVEAEMPNDDANGVTHTKYGGPSKVWSEIKITAAALPNKVSIDLAVGWLNKTTTRLAEASFVSFVPGAAGAPLRNASAGWRIHNLGGIVDPTDVVEHGAVHLHSMGPDSSLHYTGPEGTMSIASVDAPVVSCGLLSPFPTPGNSSQVLLEDYMARGLHWNVQNNIWNTNFPQWYPFEGVFGYGTQDAALGLNAAFRFIMEFA